jgi:hypothetical protein
MQAATAQLAQSGLFASNQCSQSLEIGAAAGRTQFGIDSAQGDEQLANGAGVVIAHGSLDRVESRCPTV